MRSVQRAETSWLQDLIFVQQLLGRMAAAKEKLQARLATALRAALNGGNTSARQHCLQAYAAIGDGAGAEQACYSLYLVPSLVYKVFIRHYAHGQLALAPLWRYHCEALHLSGRVP